MEATGKGRVVPDISEKFLEERLILETPPSQGMCSDGRFLPKKPESSQPKSTLVDQVKESSETWHECLVTTETVAYLRVCIGRIQVIALEKQNLLWQSCLARLDGYG